MLELIAYQPLYLPAIRQLFTEHLQAARDLAQAEFLVKLDVPDMLERELNDEALAALYTPPRGYLLLAQLDDAIVGCAAIRQLDAQICELCRMYIQPAYRRQGIARALLDRLITVAATAHYTTIRLDTPVLLISSTLTMVLSKFSPIQVQRFRSIDNPIGSTWNARSIFRTRSSVKPSPPAPLPSLGEGSQSRRRWRGDGEGASLLVLSPKPKVQNLNKASSPTQLCFVAQLSQKLQ
jgi:GNAT superfamily N-acetyltransferase